MHILMEILSQDESYAYIISNYHLHAIYLTLSKLKLSLSLSLTISFSRSFSVVSSGLLFQIP